MSRIIELKSTPVAEVVREAVTVLESGGIVVYPTETIYGMGVDATNQEAVNKLLFYRARREGKPLSVAVCDATMAGEYVEVNAIAKNLYTNFLPGPLTVISHSKGLVAAGVEAENGTLGIRIPDYPLVLDMVKALGKPVVATTAAPASMQKRPYSIQELLDGLSDKQKAMIDLIIDAGQLPKREPSTVVDTTLNQEIVLRQGSLKLTEVLERKTESAEETQELGRELMDKYLSYLGTKSIVFALQGELGAGKTQLSKGIARALGVQEVVQSPTFTIENEYPFESGILYHIDTWRLFDEQELLDLDFIKQIDEGNIFVIEWADRVQNLIERISSDAVIVWVGLQYGSYENERIITVSDFA